MAQHANATLQPVPSDRPDFVATADRFAGLIKAGAVAFARAKDAAADLLADGKASLASAVKAALEAPGMKDDIIALSKGAGRYQRAAFVGRVGVQIDPTAFSWDDETARHSPIKGTSGKSISNAINRVLKSLGWNGYDTAAGPTIGETVEEALRSAVAAGWDRDALLKAVDTAIGDKSVTEALRRK